MTSFWLLKDPSNLLDLGDFEAQFENMSFALLSPTIKNEWYTYYKHSNFNFRSVLVKSESKKSDCECKFFLVVMLNEILVQKQNRFIKENTTKCCPTLVIPYWSLLLNLGTS